MILNHVFDHPSGGYVGVDVFFVISGFLITSQLVREQARTGRVSLVGFYKRRIRRIAPASLLTLAVTVIATLVVVGPSRMREVATDAVWAAVSLANWHFAVIGTDYSHADGPVSPLQHFWSLAVEEQFYVVWPLVIIVLGAVFVRSRRALVVGLSVILIASLAWSVVQTDSSPTVAYFSTLTRGWELAVGALTALLAHRMTSIPRWARRVLGGSGLVGIAAAALLFSSATPFPSGWAALPVLSTALVIVSGTGYDEPSAIPLLGFKPLQYIGDISFSLYLWHYPITILAAHVFIVGGRRYPVAVLVGTALVSIASYHLVEQPIRRSAWLATSRPGERRRRLPSMLSGALVTAAVVASAVVVAVPPHAAQADQGALASLATSSDPGRTLDSQIASAVDATSWPRLTPTLDGAADDASPSMFDTACFNPADMTDGTQCTYGSPAASHLAVVVGDSIAMSWVPGVRRALGSGWRVHAVGMSNCPFIAADIIYSKPDQAERCNSKRAAEMKQIVALHPDIVVMSDLEKGVQRLADQPEGQQAVHDEWITARSAAIRQVQKTAGKVFVFTPNPVGLDDDVCSAGGQPPSNCVGGVSELWQIKADADKKAAAATGATFVDTSNWFCTPTDRCPAFVHGVLERWDIGHMTQTYSRFLAPLIRQRLLGD